MQAPTQAPASAYTNNFRNKQKMFNGGSSSNRSGSQSIQILGSDPEASHLLQYCSTEDQWNQYLKGSGLYDSNQMTNSRPSRQVPSHKLQPTAGGPNEQQENNNDSTQKYAIISIMGPQSSGKSTILNKLFGTKFDVMDHYKGRHQVT
eukprot:318910_1